MKQDVAPKVDPMMEYLRGSSVIFYVFYAQKSRYPRLQPIYICARNVSLSLLKHDPIMGGVFFFFRFAGNLGSKEAKSSHKKRKQTIFHKKISDEISVPQRTVLYVRAIFFVV